MFLSIKALSDDIGDMAVISGASAADEPCCPRLLKLTGIASQTPGAGVSNIFGLSSKNDTDDSSDGQVDITKIAGYICRRQLTKVT